MIKIVDENGKVLFEVADDATEPKLITEVVKEEQPTTQEEKETK